MCFEQLVSNDGAQRQGPLECTYILNLTYAYLLEQPIVAVSSLPAASCTPIARLAFVCLTNRRTWMCACSCSVSTYTVSLEREASHRDEEKEREAEELVNPHMCDDNREPPVERHRYPRHLFTWPPLQKEASNFDRTRSSTLLCPTSLDSHRFDDSPISFSNQLISGSPRQIGFNLDRFDKTLWSSALYLLEGTDLYRSLSFVRLSKLRYFEEIIIIPTVFFD